MSYVIPASLILVTALALICSRPVDLTFTDGLPTGWQAKIYRGPLWLTVEGWYSGEGTDEPVLVVSGWTFRVTTAREQVVYWIEETAAEPREDWLPEADAYADGEVAP